MIQKLNLLKDEINIGEIRKIPYPPNFSKIAARIMEPSTGASTWAFGSHKWVKNIGSFTKKAIIKRIGKLNFKHSRDIKGNLMDFRFKILRSKGREAIIVYINK